MVRKGLRQNEDKPIGVVILAIWKYHKEIPYVATFISS
jgi:hypothetical protein